MYICIYYNIPPLFIITYCFSAFNSCQGFRDCFSVANNVVTFGRNGDNLMFKNYVNHLKKLNSMLVTKGIVLPINLDCDEAHIYEQVTILENFLFFNNVLKKCDSVSKIESLLDINESDLDAWIREQVFSDYNAEWNNRLAKLTSQPANAGTLGVEIKPFSTLTPKEFTEGLMLKQSLPIKGFEGLQVSKGLEFDDDEDEEEEDDFYEDSEMEFEYDDDSEEEEDDEDLEEEYVDVDDEESIEDDEGTDEDEEDDEFAFGCVTNSSEYADSETSSSVQGYSTEEDDNSDSVGTSDSEDGNNSDSIGGTAPFSEDNEEDDDDEFLFGSDSEDDEDSLEEEYEDFDSYEDVTEEDSDEDDDLYDEDEYVDLTEDNDSDDEDEDDGLEEEYEDITEDNEEDEEDFEDEDLEEEYEDITEDNDSEEEDEDLEEEYVDVDDEDDFDEYSDEEECDIDEDDEFELDSPNEDDDDFFGDEYDIDDDEDNLPFGAPSGKESQVPVKSTETKSNVVYSKQVPAYCVSDDKLEKALVEGVNKGLNALWKKFTI